MYYSQFQQDKFLNENYFHNKTTGIFCDIGAHDGITLSNTYFFEQLGWQGTCIEANPDVFKLLEQNRKCKLINGCAWDSDGKKTFRKVYGYAEMLSGILETYDERHKQRIENECKAMGGHYEDVEIDSININRLLSEYPVIDFISIDTEGSEYEILKAIDFSKINVFAILVENNYGDGRIGELLSPYYNLVTRLTIDDLFIRK